jgi:hypothetical protein
LMCTPSIVFEFVWGKVSNGRAVFEFDGFDLASE